MTDVLDRRPGYVNAINAQLNGLAKDVREQGGELRHALSTAAERLATSLDTASAAADRQAGRLVSATWALVATTVALVIATGVLAYVVAINGH